MRYARLSARVDGAEHPCRAQGGYAPGCSRSRNSPTDDGGAFPPKPRHGRGTRVGSSRSAVRHFRGMPHPALAAIVIAAMLHLSKPEYLRDLFDRSRLEFSLAAIVIAAALTLGVPHGILLGV